MYDRVIKRNFRQKIKSDNDLLNVLWLKCLLEHINICNYLQQSNKTHF